jgi:hypothetical protein
VLKHCAANRKRRLSALPNVGPYIYDVKFSDFTRSFIYIYDISRLMVNQLNHACIQTVTIPHCCVAVAAESDCIASHNGLSHMRTADGISDVSEVILLLG